MVVYEKFTRYIPIPKNSNVTIVHKILVYKYVAIFYADKYLIITG